MPEPDYSAKANLKLVETVLRIREECPIFNRKVGGSSEFIESLISSAIEDANGNKRPFCWAVPLAEYGDAPDGQAGTQQRHIIMSIIVCVDNVNQKGSGLGKQGPAVVDSIHPVQQQIEDALTGWKPNSINLSAPIYFVSRSFLGMDNEEAYYQLEFQIDYLYFNPKFFSNPLYGEWTNQQSGAGLSADEVKKIALRYNDDEESVRQALDDGYFSLSNTAEPATEEQVEDFDDEATILDVEGKPKAVDVTIIDSSPSPIIPDPNERHGTTTETTEDS